MKAPTAQPGAISPAARKNGAMASIAASANTATAYFAPVRVSRGMAASSHFRVLLALKLDRVNLIAHDWAAIVGFQLCLGLPERVRSYLPWPFPPCIRFDVRFLLALRYAWYQLVIAPPVVGSRYLSKGDQRLPGYLFRRFTSDQSAWSEADIELFVAKLREPARARAGSPLYRDLAAIGSTRTI
jgi:pimeloyl-ACP methyl ester carboxylesterase